MSFVMRHSDVVIQMTAQDDVIVSAEVQCVDLVEHGNIGLETFQTQFATGMLYIISSVATNLLGV